MRIDPREQVAVAMNARGQLADTAAASDVVMGALAAADELGSALWRLRYGEIARARGMDRATALLAKRLRTSVRGRGLRDRRPSADDGGPDIFHRLARRAVWEWLHDACPACGGKVVGGMPDAGHILGERAYSCAVCHGTGRARYSDAERAMSLELDVDVFVRRWRERLDAALALLDRYDGDTERAVTAQLRPLAQSKHLA
ncbi:hypothetical protein [Ralstonia solanacearum]|uniref:hypothetical protein n=1 Tax=Ralstonia solanacearum TaxID=305 RepID=UPI00168B4860|nr:hypothetical protein [Ralstonia solanacearum]QNT25496.1 hypothetical protein C2I38_25930 [Ralstonia solanacearum]QNT63135.1 hypothetical protein C2L97_25915 [Ralstonia solanacearum]